MRASTVMASAAAAWLVSSSACSGSILLGNVDDQHHGDAGTGGGASHSGSGTGTGPVVVGGDVGPTIDASSGSSAFDSSTGTRASIDDASASPDVALGPGYTRATRRTRTGSAMARYCRARSEAATAPRACSRRPHCSCCPLARSRWTRRTSTGTSESRRRSRLPIQRLARGTRPRQGLEARPA